MVKVSVAPKQDEGGQSVSGQEAKLAEECAALMATKLITLDKRIPRETDGVSKLIIN